MKRITIYQRNNIPMTVEDSDDSPINEYSKELVSLLENNNVTILHTSTCSIIVRPDRISSIHVCSVNDMSIETLEKSECQSGDKEEKTSEDFEGIISD